MSPIHFERAMVSARRSDPEEYEAVSRWMDRWQLAVSVCYQDDGSDLGEIYEVIAPSAALNELPEGAVSRYWQVRL